MKHFEKKSCFRFQYPDAWKVDEDEDPLSIYHPDGYGAVSFIVQPPIAVKDGERIDAFLMLRAILKQTSSVDIDETASKRYAEGKLEWASSEYEEELPEQGKVWTRAWIVTNQEQVIYAVYGCREDDQDREREEVDSMVDSLELL